MAKKRKNTNTETEEEVVVTTEETTDEVGGDDVSPAEEEVAVETADEVAVAEEGTEDAANEAIAETPVEYNIPADEYEEKTIGDSPIVKADPIVHTEETTVEEVVAEAAPATETKTVSSPVQAKELAPKADASAAPINKTVKPKKVVPGHPIKLVNEPLFNIASAKSPIRTISGVYFIYDDKVVQGRCRITDQRSKVRKGINNIVGYINVK